MTFMEVGQVIPVIGQGVTTYGPDNQLLFPWMAKRLAEELELEIDDPIGAPLTLNEVVCQHLLQGRPQHVVYNRLFQILRHERPKPGKTLSSLASIDAFKLLISTTLDPLLYDACLERTDLGPTEICGYAPNGAQKDIPSRVERLRDRVIYQILGGASPAGNFVVWEDDIMDFIFSLHKDLTLSVMPNLSKDLANPNMHFLILGLSFSDWLVRFFLRAARQARISEPAGSAYIAENTDGFYSDDLVLFFNSAGQHINILNCDPREFVEELAVQWQRHSETNDRLSLSQPSIGSQAKRRTADGEPSVFLSYSSNDLAAASLLKDGLEGYGLNVWFDKTNLKNGTDFERALKQGVQSCAVFVSVISESTESAIESYFHKERLWAARRSESFSDNDRGDFYHPVVIDDRELSDIIREPEAFATAHRTRLPGGEVTPDFALRIRSIVEKRRANA
ncbi:MAG: toll/interleukin-1 receptor domain-containing protein [Planctomycetota bacterium]